jgi:NADH dehydrogenase (ubiquinone) Fe-S protein 5
MQRGLFTYREGDLLTCPQGERVQQIQTAYRKWEAENADFVAKNAKDVRSLGVIEATMEEKNLKIPKWMPHVKRN